MLTPTAPKPVQIKTWEEKNAKNKEWFKENVNYYISRSRFNGQKDSRDLALFYDVYNSKFPLSWFNHVTDPLSAKNPAHKQFPAKIRPLNMLRTNMDLLQSEYPRRPFIYQVVNLSDDAYSSYQEGLQKQVRKNLEQFFQMQLQHDLMEQGLITPDGQPASQEALQQIQQQMQNVPIPEDVKEAFNLSYKDALAVKGQKWLRRCITEQGIREKLRKIFKHWIIVGEAYSYKTVEFDQIRYKAISPLSIDFEKSPDNDYVEDSEWVVHREYMTLSDIVDRYYEVLKKENLEELENKPWFASPTAFYTHLSSSSEDLSKIPVTHATWKGKKKIQFISGMDPLTGEIYEEVVDELYPVDKSYESAEEKWVNELYEGTLIGADTYVNLQPIPFQRNVMNNYSVTKQPYNGRKFSDLHSENTSLTELGIPYLIMHIIINRTLELTIAKSKGKIFLMDPNAIPKGEGWDEEKTFYYAEALGYMMVDRNQIGVDKSWNQYQVVDMSLFDQIKQLIELQQHMKNEWDDILGINRQRKGQTYASDLVGVNERATFQSTVITDMIFNLFEDFVEKELNGLLDLSKFTELSGDRKIWNSTEYGNEIQDIDPSEYCYASFGVFVQNSSEAIALKNKLEMNVQAMLQNKVRPSTIIDVLTTENIAELKNKLKRVEEIEDDIAKQQQQQEGDIAQQQDERRMKLEELLHEFRLDEIREKGEVEKELEHIKGTYNTFTFQNGDANANGQPDASEVQKLLLEREKLNAENRHKNADRNLKEKEMESKERIAKAKKPTTKS